MIPKGVEVEDDAPDELDPLSRGAAAPPPVIGGGCLARFDPLSLNEDCGADFSPAGAFDPLSGTTKAPA